MTSKMTFFTVIVILDYNKILVNTLRPEFFHLSNIVIWGKVNVAVDRLIFAF